MRQTLFTVMITLLVLTCGQAEFEDAMMTEASAAYEMDEAAQDQSDAQDGTEQTITPKIIKNADLRIKVDNVKASTERVNALAEEFDGYVSEMNLTNSTYEINNHIILRVSQEHFDALLSRLAEEARFTDYRRIHTQDVTAEFIDLETRLKTKRAVRDRYLDILRNQAKTVEDILRTEEQLRQLQEEIESAEGRLKYLNNRVSFSTINVNIYEELPYKATAKYSFGEKVVRSLKNGWDLIVGIVLGLITIWPLLIIAALLIWQRKRLLWWRKRKQT